MTTEASIFPTDFDNLDFSNIFKLDNSKTGDFLCGFPDCKASAFRDYHRAREHY
jgi:hypothetical protein